jgi:hypothetical protein
LAAAARALAYPTTPAVKRSPVRWEHCLDADRFDHLSRSFAARTTRRRALFAGSGFLAALGLSRAAARAQDDTTICTLDLVAGIRLGPTFDNRPQPDQPFESRGQLRFGIGEQGRLVDGKLRMADDTEYDAVGQVAGPAITIRIAAGPDRTIVLVGAGENALRSCNGDGDGMMTGPMIGDLDDWHATAAQTANQPPSNQPTQAPAFVPTQAPTAPAVTTNTKTPTPVSDQAVPTETATPEADGVAIQAPTELPVVTAVICLPMGSICDEDADCCSGVCKFTLRHCDPPSPASCVTAAYLCT